MKKTRTFLLTLGAAIALFATACSDTGGRMDGGPIPDAGTRDAMTPAPRTLGSTPSILSPTTPVPSRPGPIPSQPGTTMPSPTNPSPTLPVPTNNRINETGTPQ